MLTLHADRDDFHVSVPLEPVRERGIVVYGSATAGWGSSRAARSGS